MIDDHTASAERRKHVRSSLSYQIVLDAGAHSLAVTTSDLAFGGALIGSRTPLAVGASLAVTIASDGLFGSSLARVVRNYHNGFAIEFTESSDAFVEVLARILTPALPRHAAVASGNVVSVDFSNRTRLAPG